jgi:hypothetical protein
MHTSSQNTPITSPRESTSSPSTSIENLSLQSRADSTANPGPKNFIHEMVWFLMSRKYILIFFFYQRNYMPGPHRKFIQAISDSYSIRAAVEDIGASCPELVMSFNRCVEGMKAFRDKHIQMVSVYIVIQARKRVEVGNSISSPGIQSDRLQQVI